MSIIFWRQFSGFKCLRFRRHISSNVVKYREISSNIVRLKYQKFFINIAKYHLSWWLILEKFRCYQNMPLVKQELSWAEQVWWEPSVLKHIKLKLRLLKNKHLSTKAICTYLYHTCVYLYWSYFKLAVFCRLAANFIPANTQNVGILKDIDQKIKP